MTYTFASIEPILAKLNDAGYQAYLTGGSARDYFLYGNFNDIDIATDAKPDEVSAVFSGARYDKFSAEFGTFKGIADGLPVEITSFRLERFYVKRRHPSRVTFIDDPELDSQRRDLTINALYIDRYGDVLDFHDGKKDLENKILRLIGDPEERINEDPVRILRLIRFQLEFGFAIDPATEEIMRKYSALVEEISPERQRREMRKFLKIASLPEIKKALAKYDVAVPDDI